jgi:hypothetical protein
MKRAQITSSYLTEALSERSESARENPIGVGFSFSLLSADIFSCIIQARGVTNPPVGVRAYQRSRSSFAHLPWEGIYPSGLYTAIVHNGPLRTRIQDHLDESEELKAHVRRAQELLSGWLVTLYHLMLVVAWNALVCALLTSFTGGFTVPFKESTIRHLADLYKRHIRARISWIPCTAWIKQAMSLGYITSLSLINLTSRQALGRGLVSPHLVHDSEICPRGKFEA